MFILKNTPCLTIYFYVENDFNYNMYIILYSKNVRCLDLLILLPLEDHITKLIFVTDTDFDTSNYTPNFERNPSTTFYYKEEKSLKKIEL